MSGLELILIAVNIGAGIVGFGISTFTNKFLHRKERKRNQQVNEETKSTLDQIKSLLYAQSTIPQTPSETSEVIIEGQQEPYGNEQNYYELRPFYNTRTQTTEMHYETPRPSRQTRHQA